MNPKRNLIRIPFAHWMAGLVFLMLASFGSSRALGIEILDPSRILLGVAQYRHAPSSTFEQSMQCGQEAAFDLSTSLCNVTCKRSYCISRCEPAERNLVHYYTGECSDDLVHVFGENGWIVEVPRTEFERESGFWIQPALEQVGQFVQPEPSRIEITRGLPSTTQIIVDGKLQPIELYTIEGRLIFGDGLQTQNIYVTVSVNENGLTQMARFALEDTEFFKLHGLIWRTRR